METDPGRQRDFRTGYQEIDGLREGRLFAGDLLKIIFVQPTIRATGGNGCDGIRVPACMDQPKSVEIQPQRKGQEPCGAIQRLRRADPETRAKAAMLGGVLCVTRTQRDAVGIEPMEKQRVEFVVSHDPNRRARLHKCHHPVQHGSIIRAQDVSAGIDEIAKKGDTSVWCRKTQACLKPVRICMKVGNNDGLRQIENSCMLNAQIP